MAAWIYSIFLVWIDYFSDIFAFPWINYKFLLLNIFCTHKKFYIIFVSIYLFRINEIGGKFDLICFKVFLYMLLIKIFIKNCYTALQNILKKHLKSCRVRGGGSKGKYITF